MLPFNVSKTANQAVEMVILASRLCFFLLLVFYTFHGKATFAAAAATTPDASSSSSTAGTTTSTTTTTQFNRRHLLTRQASQRLLQPTATIAKAPFASSQGSRSSSNNGNNKKSNKTNAIVVSKHDVNELVRACLKDPSINLAAIPDVLEFQIYRTVVELTLHAVYQGLAAIHGKELVLGGSSGNGSSGSTGTGHLLCVQRASRRRARLQRDIARVSQMTRVNDDILQAVATRLLHNRIINQPLLPDAVERALYANCLKIIFRVLDLIAVSFRITLCGHDLGIRLQPTTDTEARRQAVQSSVLQRVAEMGQQSSSPSSPLSSSIDLAQVQAAARKIMSRQRQTDVPSKWWHRLVPWRQWWNQTTFDLWCQLYGSLYCLVLGIVDDLLEHTEIQLLSDSFRFDLVPADIDEDETEENVDTHSATTITTTTIATAQEQRQQQQQEQPTVIAASSSTRQAIAPVVAGIMVGMAMQHYVVPIVPWQHAWQQCRQLWSTLTP